MKITITSADHLSTRSKRTSRILRSGNVQESPSTAAPTSSTGEEGGLEAHVQADACVFASFYSRGKTAIMVTMTPTTTPMVSGHLAAPDTLILAPDVLSDLLALTPAGHRVRGSGEVRPSRTLRFGGVRATPGRSF